MKKMIIVLKNFFTNTLSACKKRIPLLSIGQRVFIYVSMILFSYLSLVHVVYECFLEPVAITIYVLAACSLFIGAYYLAIDLKDGLLKKIETKIKANVYISRFISDSKLKSIILLVVGLIVDVVFAIFNGCIAFYIRSAWLGTLAAYYLLLSIMRLHVLLQVHKTTKLNNQAEINKVNKDLYHHISILFILMAIVLGGAVILLYDSSGGKSYPGYTIYIVAMFSFYKIISATLNLVKEKESLLLKTIRRIGYLDACFSILTLQSAMFTSFSDGQIQNEAIMNAITGAVVCVIVLFMGIQGVTFSSRKKK